MRDQPGRGLIFDVGGRGVGQAGFTINGPALLDRDMLDPDAPAVGSAVSGMPRGIGFGHELANHAQLIDHVMRARISVRAGEPAAQIGRLARAGDVDHDPVDRLPCPAPREGGRRHDNRIGIFGVGQCQRRSGLRGRGWIDLMDRAGDLAVFGIGAGRVRPGQAMSCGTGPPRKRGPARIDVDVT